MSISGGNVPFILKQLDRGWSANEERLCPREDGSLPRRRRGVYLQCYPLPGASAEVTSPAYGHDLTIG